ncbi:MAG: hypothetical protein Q9222_001781 [Ikaeria aurantiellina]
MSLSILVRESPRSIALASEHHALIFRYSASGSVVPTDGLSDASSRSLLFSKCVVEFSPLQSLDLSGYRSIQTSGVQGTLGLINIGTDTFLCVISAAVKVAVVRPGESVQRILAVDFCWYSLPSRTALEGCLLTKIEDCLNRGDFDQTYNDIHPHSVQYATTDEQSYGHGVDPREAALDHPCIELKKVLSGGTFYYSVDFDLTNRLQDRLSEGSAFDVDSLDEEFLWNAYMIDPLIRFRARLSQHEKIALDESRMLTSAIRGFVSTVTISAASSPLRALRSNHPSNLTVLSRLSCRRAGTRFNSRGIDDDGYVANFVESETVLWHPSGLCFSYAQIRGSVPVFWEQATGLLPNQQKIQITRSPEATQPAFDKHFEHLELAYGTVHILNLMSATKVGELELTARYLHHIQQSSLNQTIGIEGASERRLIQSQFDFHAETKGPGGYEAASMVRRLIHDRAESFAYFLSQGTDDPSLSSPRLRNPNALQATVILQQEGAFRTNCLDCLDRTNLIQTIISQMAIESFLTHRDERATADFWMRHSTIWADNGDALSKIYAGTGALKSSFTRHGKMSLAGAIADARKSATRLYINNFADKSRQNTIDMLLVGTFNLNGKDNGIKEDLSAWLNPPGPGNQIRQPDIIAVGFQEIVELSPQQIMATDPARRQEWEEAVRRTINDKTRYPTQEEYVLLRSGQLVGAALIVFVMSSALKKIKNVEGSVKKTGMSGIAGNKGAVAIRLDYANSRICFVTAHLAAGFANYEERNRDFRTINHGLRFQRNRSIDDHDTIIWLGDFNYRIGLSDDKLNLQMVAGRAFPFYSESPITFKPTYKYKNGTDVYDDSEKARIPAWCDRILRKGTNLKQINYGTAPLHFSDHRPVYATFHCTVQSIDEQKKEELSRSLYERRLHAAGSTVDEMQDDKDAVGHIPIARGLPPASSDRRKWWLDNGLPARSQIRPPSNDMVLNPDRPPNPFTATKEPDWTSNKGFKKLPDIGQGKTPPPAPPSKRGRGNELHKGAQSASSDATTSIDQVESPLSPSTASEVRRKPAPPVPRKPAVLSSTETDASTGTKNGSEQGSTTARESPGHDRNMHSDRLGRATPAIFPRQISPLMDSPSATPGSNGFKDPSRAAGLSQSPLSSGKGRSKTSGRRENILDEDSEGALGIPSLQPLRPS